MPPLSRRKPNSPRRSSSILRYRPMFYPSPKWAGRIPQRQGLGKVGIYSDEITWLPLTAGFEAGSFDASQQFRHAICANGCGFERVQAPGTSVAHTCGIDGKKRVGPSEVIHERTRALLMYAREPRYRLFSILDDCYAASGISRAILHADYGSSIASSGQHSIF
jgi:hypothetical protein